MADNVIKEFLVGLGFKVDNQSQKKFEDGLDFATAKAVALGEAMYDVAKSVAESVVKMAAEFDQLYWRTQRLGSSAIDIRAFSYAMSQLGGSSQGAASALENIAEFVKSSPGATDFLLQWGVLPEHIGDAEKSLQDLAETFKKLPYWQAKSIASLIGIDPLTIQAMKRDTGEFEKWYRGMAARIGKRFGVDFNDTADGAHNAETKLRELKAELGLLVEVFLIKALPAINQFLGKFIEFLENLDHAKVSTPEVVAALTAIAVGAAALSSPFIAAAAAIGAATAAYEGWLSKSPSKPGEPAKQGYENGWGIPGLFWFYNETDQEKKDRLAGNYGKIAKPVNRGVDPVGDPNNLIPDWMRGGANDNGRAGNGARRNGRGTRAERNNNPGNISDGSFARRQPGYIGSDGRFAIFADVASGLNAMQRLLQSYMARGRDTISEIIARWAPSSENNVGAYVAHVEQLTGIGRFDQLQMSDIRRVAAAMAQHEGFRGLGVSGAGRSATVNQTNTYHVTSNADPRAVAHEIASIQDSVNQRLVANFGLIVQ